MDSYYQQGSSQQQQQQQQQLASQQQAQQAAQQQLVGGPTNRADLIGIPSAPTMQSGGLQNQMLGQQQPIQPPQHHQSSVGHSSGGGGGSRSAAAYQQQQQVQQQPSSISQLQGSGAYLDSQGYVSGQQAPLGAGGSTGSHRMNGMNMHHHHGGQPPLPPGVHSGGREHSSGSGGRYSHRQAALHQHRSSAAAISDPMMASTITDHLASASGPLTGSGSALNQLGAGGGYSSFPGYRNDPNLGAGYPQPIEAGGGYPNPQQQHQSRYDGHYLRSGAGQSRHTPAGANQSYAAETGASTIGGAYHLNRADQAALLLSEHQQRASGYYPGQLSGSHAPLHQSLGHLPSIGSRQEQHLSSRYGLDPMLGGGGHTSGQDRYSLSGGGQFIGESGRAGSMPPLTSTDGLGSYNPLDDPLAAGHQLHSSRNHQLHQQQHQAAVNDLHQQQSAFVGGATQFGGVGPGNREMYVTELRARLQEAQNSYVAVKRELETATQKLGSSMHSIKSFWSPELKKERALRKEEATKYALVNDQMKLMRVEVQKQALLIRQLEDELRLAHETRIRTTDPDIQQHIDALCMEKEGLFKENCLLRETIRELEMRIETQKQTLAARDDSIRKMVEMMNNKGIATKIMEDERVEMDRIKTRNIELEARCRHYETIIEAKEKDIIKSDQSINKGSLSTSLSLHDTTTTKARNLPEAKSPIPKQRKSKPSKAERLKSRLANKNPLPSKERLNELIIQQSASSMSSSTSSGISSSKSSNDLVPTSTTSESKSKSADTTTETGNKWQQKQQSSSFVGYRLCRCTDCMQSGQQIYSIHRQPVNPNPTVQDLISNFKQSRPPTPPKLAPRKAVSFRSSVEHIGSPRSGRPMSLGRLMNYDTNTGFSNMLTNSDMQVDESCDSLHCTKDLSLYPPEDEDYLRPLDCSTPKDLNEQQRINSTNHQSLANERLVTAEVHPHPPSAPPTASKPFRANYTCLCSPDFLCVHNYPQQQQTAPVPQPRAITNELYGTTQTSDFQLSNNCVDCKNLSTYVNLSRNNNASYLTQQTRDLNFLPTANNSFHSIGSLNGNGYGSLEYRQQLKSQQNNVYGNYGILAPNTEEQLHYLSAARQLQQTLNNCELCKRQLQLGIQCNCSQSRKMNTNGDGTILNNGDNQLDLSSTKSYHTATSSFNGTRSNPMLQQNCSRSLKSTGAAAATANPTPTALLNASELSVLPVNGSNQNTINTLLPAEQNKQPNETSGFVLEGSSSNTNLGANGIDSSLSSLFVYRHVSDDNQAVEEDDFDPDSLELSRQSIKQANNQSLNKQQQSKVQNSSSCSKVRPSSEYISISSATSNGSIAPKNTTRFSSNNNPTKVQQVQQQQKQNCIGSATSIQHHNRSKSSGGLIPIGADLTQSSLAKRRHLSHLNLQQQQQQKQQQQQQSSGTIYKRKILANSRVNSRSSPNLATEANQNSRSSSRNNNSRSSNQSASSNGKLSIYQSLKNHLLDIRKSSSSQSQSSSSQVNKLSGSSASLPRNLASSLNSKNRNNLISHKMMEELRAELTKRDQELLTMNAKMKALEEQQRDSQRHIRVLKDSLVAKEEHYNLLLTDVEELRRNLDERNKLIEKKSFQQTLGANANRAGGDPRMKGGYGVNLQELQELQSLLELRDKKIGDLQRRVVQLDGLLSERDAQLERARVRFEHHSSGNHHPDIGLLNHLEESLGDKEKQISLIRDQRDRAEHELNEERDSHERSIKEYKMKLNSAKFEMDKLQSRLNKTSMFDGKYGSNVGDSYGNIGSSGDRFGGLSANDQAALIKRLELDKRSLQLECERLKDKLETGSLERRRLIGGAGSGSSAIDRASSALGDYSVVEFERLQEALEGQKQELRRAQAECRMNEMERKRAQEEADKLSERYERAQAEMHKLKAKLENATSEREQLLEDYERQQQLISKTQTERDCALSDINQLKLENERLQQNFNKIQLQAEKLQAQVDRNQLEYKKLEDRFNETSDELRRLQGDKSSSQRELKSMEMNLQTAQLQQQRLQQERDLIRVDLEKVREKHERLEAEMERYLHDKELNQQQLVMYKERIDGQQQQASKLAKEREQMSMEIHELRDRLLKQQKLQDSSELETRNEVRSWKEKYERLLAQFEKLNQDILAKDKESQMVMEKLQRVQSEAVKLESKLEQCEMDRERQTIELEKLQQLQEMYTKTNTKLLKLSEVEEKLRIDHDKCQMDLEVLRERYEKLQVEFRKLQSERDRLQVEHERIRFDNKRIQQSQGSQQATQEDFIRLQSEVDRLVAKLEQYQREMNKVQLEKERLILDSKSMVQQTEQQYQQQLVKLKSNEEKANMELERARLQLEKVQSKYEQMNIDQEKLVADKERLQQQLLLLQQEVDKFRNQQSSSVQETKKLHDDEMQRVLQELETIREKYTQQRKELLQLRELQQNHEIDKDILKRELESAEQRLEKLNQSGSKQKQDSERCMIEMEKMKDKIERKQQELVRTQKERNQFAQEITVLHQQIQQLQVQYDQLQQQQKTNNPTATNQPSQATQQTNQQQQQSQQQSTQFKPEEINKLKQMLVKSENDLQKTMAENQRFQMEVERLKLQLDDAAEYIGKIEGDNKMLSKQNQEIIQQLKQVQQQQQQQQSTAAAASAAASGGQQQQAAAAAANQQQQEAMQQEMKKMQDVIKKSAHEIQKMVEERNKLQEMNKELQRNMEQTKVEFNSTMDQYEAELQRLQQEAQQRQQQLQQQQQQTSSQQSNDEYKVKFEKAVEAIRAFQKTSDDMKKEIIKLNERNKSLSDQNQNLIQSLKVAEENLQKRADSTNANDGDKSSKSDEPEMRQKLVQLNEICGKLERDLNKSHEEIQKHQQANQQLKQTLDKSQSEMTNLKTERDRFQSQLEKLVVELERREDEMANLQTQQDKSGQNLSAKQNELVAYQKQLEEREKSLEAKREELQNLSKQIQQQRQQQQPPAANQQQQQEMVIKLQQQIKSLEEERNKLRSELERVRGELKQSQAELERLLTILTSSEEDKFNLTQQIEQLQAKLKSMPPAGGQQQQMPKGSTQPATSGSQQQQQQLSEQQRAQQQQQQRAGQAPQQQPRSQQQQAPPQKPAAQSQRPSGGGASGFISGFFQ